MVPPSFAMKAHRVAVAIQEHDARDDEDSEENSHYDPYGGVRARGCVSPPQLCPSCCEVGQAGDMWDRVRRRGGPRGERWGGGDERARGERDIHPMLALRGLIVYSNSFLETMVCPQGDVEWRRKRHV